MIFFDNHLLSTWLKRERERVVLQATWEGKRGAGEKRRKNFGGGAKGVNKKQWR